MPRPKRQPRTSTSNQKLVVRSSGITSTPFQRTTTNFGTKLRSGRNKFSTDIAGIGSQQAFFGERLNLFTGAIDIDPTQLATFDQATQQAVAQAMVKLAREARDKARSRAPKRSGALRAGIYITSAPNASEMKSAAEGVSLKQGAMLGHSSGYFKAITSALNKRAGGASDVFLPGQHADDPNRDIIFPRTQRTLVKNRSTKQVLDHDAFLKELGDDIDERPTYRVLNEALPFNPLGKVGANSFYVGLGSAMYYSAWVEYGTSRQPAQAFFTPAAMWMVSEGPKRMADAIKNVKVKVKPIARGSKR